MAKIDHLGIAVKSIAQARHLYEALGLTVLDETGGEEDVRSAMIPLGDSRLRLLEPLNHATELGKFLEQHGEGRADRSVAEQAHLKRRAACAVCAPRPRGHRVLSDPRSSRA